MTAHSSLSRQGSSIVAFPSKIAWERKIIDETLKDECFVANLDCFLEEQDTVVIVLCNVSLVRAQRREKEQQSQVKYLQWIHLKLRFLTGTRMEKLCGREYLYLVFWYAKAGMILDPRQQLWEETIGCTIGLDNRALVEEVGEDLGRVQCYLRRFRFLGESSGSKHSHLFIFRKVIWVETLTFSSAGGEVGDSIPVRLSKVVTISWTTIYCTKRQESEYLPWI